MQATIIHRLILGGTSWETMHSDFDLHLIQENANIRDEHGQTPLDAAIFQGLPMIVDILIKGGADVKAKGVNGRTALHYAIAHCPLDDNSEDKLETINLLLKAGADVNATDDNGRTPAHIAAWWFRTDIILHFLKTTDVDMKAQSKEEGTPFDIFFSKCLGKPEAQEIMICIAKKAIHELSTLPPDKLQTLIQQRNDDIARFTKPQSSEKKADS